MVAPADQELVCELCGETFTYSVREQVRDRQMGYPAPRACDSCLRQRRAAAAAKRAARRPRKRPYRR